MSVAKSDSRLIADCHTINASTHALLFAKIVSFDHSNAVF